MLLSEKSSSRKVPANQENGLRELYFIGRRKDSRKAPFGREAIKRGPFTVSGYTKTQAVPPPDAWVQALPAGASNGNRSRLRARSLRGSDTTLWCHSLPLRLRFPLKKEEPLMGRTLKDSFESTLPTDRKQKPQIDFLRFLCYNKNINLE